MARDTARTARPPSRRPPPSSSAPALAIFCDFDGTFAVQDVGATIAKRYAGERRAALWERLRRGELSPWDYNLELLDGLALPETELDAFLATVELDPGAPALLDWCKRHGAPFRILSDGFDRNLDWLQARSGLYFEYDANHLRYRAGRWEISPGAPDDACGCGTGTCKRGRIRAFRETHPGVVTAHIGNGRVSDLCGVEEADLAFAKDSLADALRERGRRFAPFRTLDDVVAGLDDWLRQRQAV